MAGFEYEYWTPEEQTMFDWNEYVNRCEEQKAEREAWYMDHQEELDGLVCGGCPVHNTRFCKRVC